MYYMTVSNKVDSAVYHIGEPGLRVAKTFGFWIVK